MRSWHLGGAAAAAVVFLAGAALQPGARAQDGPRWLADWNAAQAASRESGRPIFAAFR